MNKRKRKPHYLMVDYPNGPTVIIDPPAYDADPVWCKQQAMACVLHNGRLYIFIDGVHVCTYTLEEAYQLIETACESTTSQQATA